MAGSWLDAILGAIRDRGTSLPLMGGLNFTGGLKATRNTASARIDVSLVNPPQTPAVQTEWEPVGAVPSDTLEAMPEDHEPGFYLVGTQVSFGTAPVDGTFTPTFTWSEGASDGEIVGEAIDAAELIAAPPQLVYSDGSAAITVTWESTTTDETASGTVRAVALRVSG